MTVLGLQIVGPTGEATRASGADEASFGPDEDPDGKQHH